MSDKKYIERLKNDIANLQKLNKQLEATRNEAIQHLQNCDMMVRKMTIENEAGRRILWAIANSLGGRVEVPDSSMSMAADDKNLLTSSYDKEKRVTVIEAKTSIAKPGELPDQ